MKKHAYSVRKITVNLPEELLRKVQVIIHKNLTDTLIAGLEEILRRHQLKALHQLRGKIKFELDLKKTRQ